MKQKEIPFQSQVHKYTLSIKLIRTSSNGGEVISIYIVTISVSDFQDGLEEILDLLLKMFRFLKDIITNLIPCIRI